jgi:hypothetical protein
MSKNKPAYQKKWLKDHPGYNKRWRQDNPDRVREYVKRHRIRRHQWRKEHPNDARPQSPGAAESHRRWCEENPEKVKERNHRYYIKHREEHIAQARAYYKKHREQIRAQGKITADRRAAKRRRITDAAKAGGCARCGHKDLSALDFHHVDPRSKKRNVSTYAPSWSEEELRAEIAKCVVLCANCHRALHAEERRKRRAENDIRSMNGRTLF